MSSGEQLWNLTVLTDWNAKILRVRLVIYSTGYYDYKNPLETKIPGIDNFIVII
jgi:hypothetical protein